MRIPRVVSLALSIAVAVPLALATSATAVGTAVPERPAPAQGHVDRTPSESYELLQLNLCLSGLAGCFADTEYPNVVDEAIVKIQTHTPEAVTVNEACSGDVDRIAEETGYDVAFATVIYNGAPLPCRNPGERGVFGNAVLVDGEILSSEDQAFGAQLGAEQRRWLCAVSDADVRVCTTHLSVAGSEAQAATNDAQCAEVATLLRQNPQRQATILGGDVNRQESCAAPGLWTATDSAAAQAAGIQHVYGSRKWLNQPQAQVIPMTYTDHDALLVSATLRQLY